MERGVGRLGSICDSVQRSVCAGDDCLLAQLYNLLLVGRLELVNVAMSFPRKEVRVCPENFILSKCLLLLCLLFQLGLVLVKDSLVGLLVGGQKANVVHLRPSSLREASCGRKSPGDVSSR